MRAQCTAIVRAWRGCRRADAGRARGATTMAAEDASHDHRGQRARGDRAPLPTGGVRPRPRRTRRTRGPRRRRRHRPPGRPGRPRAATRRRRPLGGSGPAAGRQRRRSPQRGRPLARPPGGGRATLRGVDGLVLARSPRVERGRGGPHPDDGAADPPVPAGRPRSVRRPAAGHHGGRRHAPLPRRWPEHRRGAQRELLAGVARAVLPRRRRVHRGRRPGRRPRPHRVAHRCRHHQSRPAPVGGAGGLRGRRPRRHPAALSRPTRGARCRRRHRRRGGPRGVLELRGRPLRPRRARPRGRAGPVGAARTPLPRRRPRPEGARPVHPRGRGRGTDGRPRARTDAVAPGRPSRHRRRHRPSSALLEPLRRRPPPAVATQRRRLAGRCHLAHVFFHTRGKPPRRAAADGNLDALADALGHPAGFRPATRAALTDLAGSSGRDGGVSVLAVALASPDLVQA